MTFRTPFRRRAAAVPAAAALLVAFLTACGADSPSGDTGSAPVQQQSTADAESGISRDLPPGFPADDIPLADGEIVSSGGTEEEGIWIVVIRSDSSVDSAKDAAIGLLTAAGFAESDDMAGMGVYTDGTYTIIVRGGLQDGQTILNYSIATES